MYLIVLLLVVIVVAIIDVSGMWLDDRLEKLLYVPDGYEEQVEDPYVEIREVTRNNIEDFEELNIPDVGFSSMANNTVVDTSETVSMDEVEKALAEIYGGRK